jgi:precorrin-6B methylase 2
MRNVSRSSFSLKSLETDQFTAGEPQMKNDLQTETHTDEARKHEQDTRMLTHMQHTLIYHEQLLSDRVRNQTFYKALKRHVQKNDSVMDIGSGTGVWAIAAAKLGASRVVAIEKEKILIPIIEKLASKNGVRDRLEVVEGDSRVSKISGKFDLIISETVGNQAFDEEIVPIIIDAKKRFLKKGGVVIPEALAAVAAPAHLSGGESLPAGLKMEYRYLELLNLDIPKKITDQTKVKLLGAPARLTRVDLRRVSEPPTYTQMTCKWRLKDASQFNCLIVWAEVLLTKGVSLHTIRHTKSWTPVSLPVEPFERGPALIECTIRISHRQYYWIVTRNENGRRTVQSHSPVFPYTAIFTHGKVSQ